MSLAGSCTTSHIYLPIGTRLMGLYAEPNDVLPTAWATRLLGPRGYLDLHVSACEWPFMGSFTEGVLRRV